MALPLLGQAPEGSAQDLRCPDPPAGITPGPVRTRLTTALSASFRSPDTATLQLSSGGVGPDQISTVGPRGVDTSTDAPPPVRDEPRWVKHTRWALLKDPDDLSDAQLEILDALRRERSVLYRCWQLKEGLRDLYRLRRPADAPRHLDWWLAWACRSRIPSFVALSKTIRANRDRILAAVELGLSNSKLEGLNSKIRLINHRGYGHHSAAAVISMIYLCCGGITVELPTER